MVGIPKSKIIYIGKHRERAIYERPDGKGGWIQTDLLPSDADGRELYINKKGFRLLGSTPVKSNSDGLSCPFCDFVAKSPGGLGYHLMRKHK